MPAGLVVGDSVVFLTAPTWTYKERDASVKNVIYAVDPESGKARWVTSVDDDYITAPVTAKGLVFVATESSILSGSHHATLYAINAGDGQVRWKLGTGKKYGTTRLLVADNAIYFCTDRNLLALELETGRQLWNFSAEEIQGDLSADDQHLYAITHLGSFARPNDTLHALALTSGQEKWSQKLSGLVSDKLVHDGVVYAGREHLHAIDGATGKELWSFKGTGRESARLASGGRIFLTSPTVSYTGTNRVDQGYLYAIDAKTGKLKP